MKTFFYPAVISFFFMIVSINLLAQSERPNIILIMADDLGYGDVGYYNPVIKTPFIDQMAKEGVQFNRFYVSAPVCSPTRGSILTGRNPYRYGIYAANVGHMKKEELTLAEVLKGQGYTTGHFGKWHLGTLTTAETDGNRGRLNDSSHYAPPWMHGFDISFSTESKVPTWDPMITPANFEIEMGNKKAGDPNGNSYWIGEGKKETQNLSGDDSRIIMDRVLPFIKKSVETKKNFFAVVWFHTPHLPAITSETYRNIYKNYSDDEQHYYGAITAMDEQIGRLRSCLNEHKIDKNTIIFFNSDNGPEGESKAGKTQGSALTLRGRKRSLYEGGIRVPAIMIWPGTLAIHGEINTPVTSTDIFPTILSVLGINPQNSVQPLDGVDIMPIIKKGEKRGTPICFQFHRQLALIDERYKIYSPDKGITFELFDLLVDRREQNDLSKEKPAMVSNMKKILADWLQSCKRSDGGSDYH
ncbi:MAG TPA: sulfatase-like hydrolase/transferase [Flavitalea sp.]|nr:sulfatase-like hydrolase/transferase [Flavitalea sp.]